MMSDSKTSSSLVLASGGETDVILWSENLQSRKFEICERIDLFEKDDAVLGSLSWNSNNKLLACAPKRGSSLPLFTFNDGVISFSKRLESQALFQGGGEVNCACFMNNNKHILIGSSSIVNMWDVQSDECLRAFEGYSSPVTCICSNNKDSFVVGGMEDGSLMLHKTSSPHPVTNMTSDQVQNSSEIIKRVLFSPHEPGMIGSCGTSGAVRLWSVESQRLLATLSPKHTDTANDITFSPFNRMLLASVGGGKHICLHDIMQRRSITQVACPVSLHSVVLLKDGTTLIGGGSDGNVYVYNLKNCKKPEYILGAHNHPVTTLAMQKSESRRSPRKAVGKRRDTPGDPSAKPTSAKPTSVKPYTDITIGFENYSPVPIFQTPSPLVSTIHVPMTPASTSGLSAIFSPLEDSKSVSSVPRTLSTQTNRRTPIIGPTFVTHQSTISETPLNTGNLSSSIVGIFSPLDTTHSSYITTTRPSLIDQPPPPLITTITSTLPTALTNTNSTLPQSTSVSPSIQTTIPTTQVPLVSDLRTLHQDSTVIVKENPTGSIIEGSTLMGTSVRSHLEAPEIQSTPITTQQNPLTLLLPNPPIVTTTIPSSSFMQPSPLLTSPTTDTTIVSSTNHFNGALPAIQIQYLENLMTETQEEIIDSTHHDAKNLSILMLREFAILRNQMVLALTTISQKIDKLSSEVEQLTHQMNHLTPKY